jgi:hypothetical protein
MKTFITILALTVSVSSFAKDIYWSNKKIENFKYINDESGKKKAIFECFQNDRLIIQGKVKERFFLDHRSL